MEVLQKTYTGDDASSHKGPRFGRVVGKEDRNGNGAVIVGQAAAREKAERQKQQGRLWVSHGDYSAPSREAEISRLLAKSLMGG